MLLLSTSPVGWFSFGSAVAGAVVGAAIGSVVTYWLKDRQRKRQTAKLLSAPMVEVCRHLVDGRRKLLKTLDGPDHEVARLMFRSYREPYPRNCNEMMKHSLSDIGTFSQTLVEKWIRAMTGLRNLETKHAELVLVLDSSNDDKVVLDKVKFYRDLMGECLGDVRHVLVGVSKHVDKDTKRKIKDLLPA